VHACTPASTAARSGAGFGSASKSFHSDLDGSSLQFPNLQDVSTECPDDTFLPLTTDSLASSPSQVKSDAERHVQAIARPTASNIEYLNAFHEAMRLEPSFTKAQEELTIRLRSLQDQADAAQIEAAMQRDAAKQSKMELDILRDERCMGQLYSPKPSVMQLQWDASTAAAATAAIAGTAAAAAVVALNRRRNAPDVQAHRGFALSKSYGFAKQNSSQTSSHDLSPLEDQIHRQVSFEDQFITPQKARHHPNGLHSKNMHSPSSSSSHQR
jgi:hypothetical protein